MITVLSVGYRSARSGWKCLNSWIRVYGSRHPRNSSPTCPGSRRPEGPPPRNPACARTGRPRRRRSSGRWVRCRRSGAGRPLHPCSRAAISSKKSTLELHLDVRVVGHPLDPRGVAVSRQTLPRVVEVAVVVGVANRQPADDLGGKVLGVGLPLLGGVVADECLVQRAADQGDALLLEVRRVLDVELAGELVDQRPEPRRASTRRRRTD